MVDIIMKEIVNRGRTLDAVINPKNYPPFSKITSKAAFDSAWASNPDWIFANMAHAAYCDPEYCRELHTRHNAGYTLSAPWHLYPD